VLCQLPSGVLQEGSLPQRILRYLGNETSHIVTNVNLIGPVILDFWLLFLQLWSLLGGNRLPLFGLGGVFDFLARLALQNYQARILIADWFHLNWVQGDSTLVPKMKFEDLKLLLVNPTNERMVTYRHKARQYTWSREPLC
jgi:hypothetical protein